jgi:hypothetical protein
MNGVDGFFGVKRKRKKIKKQEEKEKIRISWNGLSIYIILITQDYYMSNISARAGGLFALCISFML